VSACRDWCNPIPPEGKVDIVQAFLKAFHDEDSSEIALCSVCRMQKKPRDLKSVGWRAAIPANIQSAMVSLFACRRCFLEEDVGAGVPICLTSPAAFDRQQALDVCIGSTMHISCEHSYPKELQDLMPLEEKLIALNAVYSFITKFNV